MLHPVCARDCGGKKKEEKKGIFLEGPQEGREKPCYYGSVSPESSLAPKGRREGREGTVRWWRERMDFLQRLSKESLV